MKMAAFFNHKGGVGKTTLTFHLAYALAEKNRKILIVDTDPQCNLTALAMSEENYNEMYEKEDYTIAKALEPRIKGVGDINIQEPRQIYEKIWLLPGDVKLAKYENLLPNAWNECFAGEERGLRTYSAIYRISQEIANDKNIDYVFFDLGPNIGELNKSILLGVDGFVLPVTPDIFSFRAITVVSEIVKEWNEKWEIAKQQFRNKSIEFNYQNGNIRLLGYVPQNFGIYRKRPTQSFQYWIDRIESQVKQAFTEDAIQLGNIKNYHSLIPKSQEYALPIFQLQGNRHINPGHMGMVNRCREDFYQLADNFIQRINNS